MGNVLIAIGFGIITISQVGVGVWLITAAVGSGGKAILSRRWNHSPSEFSFYGFACVVQSFPPIPLDAYRLCVFVQHKGIEISFTGLSLGFGVWNFIGSKSDSINILKNTRLRFSCLLVDHVLGNKVEDAGTQGSEHFGLRCDGCDAVLLGYLHFAFRACDDPVFWTGECNSFLLRTVADTVRSVPPQEDIKLLPAV